MGASGDPGCDPLSFFQVIAGKCRRFSNVGIITMLKTVVQVAKYSVLAAAVGLASGCASSETTKMLDDNQKAAAQALDLATQANRTAMEAKQKADAAMRTAQDAKSCCDSNSERVNRAFEKSMRK